MKKRVVIFSAFLSPFRSGAEACAEEVALRLSDRFDITIITAKLRRDLPRRDTLSPSPFPSPSVRLGTGSARDGGGGQGVGVSPVKILRVGLGFSCDKWLYPLLAPSAARKIRPDVIHAVLETFAGLALLFCTWIAPHAKRILTLQTTNRNFLRGPIIWSPHVLIAISRVLASQAAALGRTDVIVIPNGIPYAEIRQVCKNTQKVPGRIVFVGRLEKMKGIDTLLRSFSILNSQFSILHIIGSGSQRSALEQLAHVLKITDRVKFLGYVSGADLYKEYAKAETFCGLSRSEALGNVFLEAQAAGCAVLATEVGGIPEIVKDGITGILTEPDNPELASYVLTELLQNENLRTSLATAAVEHARQYDWGVIAARYETIYR